MFVLYALVFLFAFFGLSLLLNAVFFHDRSFFGHKTFSHVNKWQQADKDIWDNPQLKKLVSRLSRFAFLDKETATTLGRRLDRAGIKATPEEFTARKFVILAFAVIFSLICVLIKFWFGLLVVVLFSVFLLMKQREELVSRLLEKDHAIRLEMPRFVRTVCRNLRTNRDLYAVLQSYRKVAGPALGSELDVLLAQMRADNIARALQQFQSRLGSEEAFRFCSTLIEIERGIDQIATLDYLADDMARQAKLDIQKELSTRPAKMRRTYIPAVFVCVIMIFYVLIVFVSNQLNNLF